ncbi:MAG: Transcriptional regulator, AcrR family, partial [uncultured Nocardioidaceae bacterium]
AAHAHPCHQRRRAGSASRVRPRPAAGGGRHGVQRARVRRHQHGRPRGPARHQQVLDLSPRVGQVRAPAARRRPGAGRADRGHHRAAVHSGAGHRPAGAHDPAQRGGAGRRAAVRHAAAAGTRQHRRRAPRAQPAPGAGRARQQAGAGGDSRGRAATRHGSRPHQPAHLRHRELDGGVVPPVPWSLRRQAGGLGDRRRTRRPASAGVCCPAAGASGQAAHRPISRAM